jgi:hypothetical protein
MERMLRGLDASKVVKTLDRLHARIAERFPDADLTLVSKDLADTARLTQDRAHQIARPYPALRIGIVLVVVISVGFQAWVLAQAPWSKLRVSLDAASLTQGLEAVVNLLILAGAAVWFLMSLEQRLKRRLALKELHELRSFAHVVDMHQLTKDPTVLLSRAPRTSSSPKREMTLFQLTRYLEYCAEMLALIGKLAALYAEYTRDPQIVEAVNDVENLATNLGRKIWQKITILSALDEERVTGRAVGKKR